MENISTSLQKGQTCNAFVTDVNFSSERELTVWVQLGEVEDTLNEISVTLDDGSANALHLVDICIGTLCACKYVEDQQWYRASIVRKTSQGNWVARFIDYGNCQVFDESEFFELPSTLKQIPPLATALTIDRSLQPLESASLWTSASAKILLDLLLYSEIEITISNIFEEKIEVFCPMINDVLITNSLAIFENRQYPYSDFLIGHKFQAYISSATQQGTLVIQEMGSSLLLNQMMDLLAEYYSISSNQVVLDPSDIVPGLLVAAVYSCDENYYRAQVVSTDGNEKCTVYFIDYGNTEVKKFSSLYQLAPRFHQLPYQAIECRLHDIVLCTEKFSKDLRDFLIQKTTGESVECEIIEHVRVGSVKFSITAKCNDEKLSMCLVANGYAKLKRDAEPLEYSCIELDIGSQHEVCVSHVEHDGTFYVSLLKDAAKLDKLMDELDEYCTRAQSLTQACVNMACCSLYDQDHIWYRAKIKSVDKNTCEVMYVDYGNCASCPFSSLRRITKEFMSLRCQAIECSIPRQLSPEEIKLMESLYNKMVEVKFLRKTDSDNSYHVKVMQEGEVLFPPLVKKESSLTDFVAPNINIGLIDKVKILRVSSSENLWGRFISNESALQQLCTQLKETYGNGQSGNLKAVSVGMICIVHDTDFNQWCRGKVISTISNHHHSVRLVDVGIVKNYLQSKLYQILPGQLLKVPCQAFNFKVMGTKLSEIHKAQPDMFSSFFLDKTFEAKITSYDSGNSLYTAELFGLNDEPVELTLSKVLQKTVDPLACGDGDQNGYDPITKLQSGITVPLNESFVDVAVCFVEDPDCIWLQLQTNATVLFKLINDMQVFYAQLPSNVLTFHQPQYDALCAVKVKNQGAENWYRGRILCLYADVIEAQLIDFGSEVKVKQNDIKMLSTRFSLPDPQAIKCKLFNIVPCSKQWTNMAARELSSILKEPGTTISARFVDRHRSSYVVDVKLTVGGRAINASALLVNKGHANWQDANRITEKAAFSLKDLSSPKCLSPGSSSSSRIPKPKMFYQSPGVGYVGAEFEVIASEVTSPDDFFLLINDTCHRQKHAFLMQDLNIEYSKENGRSIEDEDFYVGLPCAVFYDKIKKWCRGAILNFKDLENIQICLVDYGCMLSYPMNEVRSLDLQYVLKAPPEAMRCTLQGIVAPLNGQWTKEAINLCIDFLECDQRNLTCTIHACAGSEFSSYFICSVRTPLKQLADELVSNGFGVRTSIMGKVSPPLKLKSFVYSNLGEVKGKEDVFFVTHVEAPNLFYCQLARHFSQLDDMMDELELYCEKNKSAATIEELIQDCMCFAKFLDKWNRAHIVAPAPNDQVKVLFIDYGNSELVPISDVLKFSNDKFFELPIQALPCSFEDIDVSTMSQEEQLEILNLMNDKILEKEFDGVVTGKTNGKLHLDLFQEGKRINDDVVKKKVVHHQPSLVPKPKSPEIYDSLQQNKVVSLSEPFFLRAGVVESVTVACCVDPHNFCLWLDKLNAERENCMSNIDGMYTAMRNSDYKLETVSQGDLICARRSKDMKWCRAKVLSVDDRDVEVFYVDTGERDTVLKAYDIKQLIMKMAKWPKLAVPCTLSNIKPGNDGKWSSQAQTDFEALVKDNQLTAQFLQVSSEKWSINLRKGDMDCGKHLVDMGLALFVESLHDGTSTHEISEESLKVKLANPWEGEKTVFISSVVSENEIYIQSMEAYDEMDDLKQIIFDDRKHLQPLTNDPEPLSFCLARYNIDDQVYRAQVLKSEPSSSADSTVYEVRFVDFGNTATVTISDMFVLTSKYAGPAQSAIRCKFASLSDTLTQQEIIEKLEELSESEDLNVLASFVNASQGEENVVNLKILDADNKMASLETYLCSGGKLETTENVATNAAPDSLHLQYTTIENILNQVSRSIYISHVHNPGHIFCQLSEFCNDLDTLMDSIETYYNEDRPEDHILSSDALPVGSPCVAKYSVDDNWYRGVVEEAIDANHLRVQFVDYGNSDSLELSSIRQSKVGFCTLPKQAIHCYVAMVDHDDTAWTGSEIIDFDSRVATLQLKATFSRLISEEKSIYEVMLRLPDETLLNKEYMKAKTDNMAQEKDDFATDTFDDVQPTMSSPADPTTSTNAQATTSSHDALPNSDTPKPILPKAVNMKGLNFECGQRKNCFISYAESSGNFFVQIAGSEGELDSLYRLCSDDAQTYHSIKSDETIFSIDSYCVAKSPDDGEWYRGQIIKLGDKPTVFFLDYGNFSTVDWNSIKPISEKTSELPIQAVACCLNGLESLAPDYHEAAVDFFFDLVESAMVNILFFQAVNGIWNVSMTVNGVHIAEKILYEIGKKFPDFVPPKPEMLSNVKEVPKTMQETGESIIRPGTILLGKIIFVTGFNSFYVSLPATIDSCSTNVNLTSCKLKQNAEDAWENGFWLKMDDFNDLIVLENDLAYLASQLHKVELLEGERVSKKNILNCKLESFAEFSSVKGLTDKFVKGILNKNVFVTFSEYDSGSSKWVVNISMSGGDVSQLFQASFECFHDQTHLDKVDDMLRYNMLVLKQLKEMLSENVNSDTTLQFIDTAMQNVESYTSLIAKAKVMDDKKRHFSCFTPTPSPCKKPRLDTAPLPYHGTPVIFESIPEQDETALALTPSDVHLSSLFCVESPDCFYVKPQSFVTDLLPVVTTDQLLELENAEANTLCAFIDGENEFMTVKRGYVLAQNEDEVELLDIDTGFKFALALDKVFAYPKEWEGHEPLVVCCSLYGLLPFEGEWTTEACAFFSELIEPVNGVFVKFVSKCECDKPVQKWKVDIAVDEKSVSNLLIEKDFAKTEVEEFAKHDEEFIAEVHARLKQAEEVPAKSAPSSKESRQSEEGIDQNQNEEIPSIHKDDEKESGETTGYGDQEVEKESPAEAESVDAAGVNKVEHEETSASGGSSSQEEETNLDDEAPNYPSHPCLAKTVGFRLKLVDSSSLSCMSDSVFAPDEAKDSAQETTGDGVFSIGLRSNERMPGFIIPMASDAIQPQSTLPAETDKEIQGSDSVMIPDELKSMDTPESEEKEDMRPKLEIEKEDKIQTAARDVIDEVYASLPRDVSEDKKVNQLLSPEELKQQRLPGFMLFGGGALSTEEVPKIQSSNLAVDSVEILAPKSQSVPVAEKNQGFDDSVPDTRNDDLPTEPNTIEGHFGEDEKNDGVSEEKRETLELEDEELRSQATVDEETLAAPALDVATSQITSNNQESRHLPDSIESTQVLKTCHDEEELVGEVECPQKGRELSTTSEIFQPIESAQCKPNFLEDPAAMDSSPVTFQKEFEDVYAPPSVSEVEIPLNTSLERSDMDDESNGVEIIYSTVEESLKQVVNADVNSCTQDKIAAYQQQQNLSDLKEASSEPSANIDDDIFSECAESANENNNNAIWVNYEQAAMAQGKEQLSEADVLVGKDTSVSSRDVETEDPMIDNISNAKDDHGTCPESQEEPSKDDTSNVEMEKRNVIGALSNSRSKEEEELASAAVDRDVHSCLPMAVDDSSETVVEASADRLMDEITNFHVAEFTQDEPLDADLGYEAESKDDVTSDDVTNADDERQLKTDSESSDIESNREYSESYSRPVQEIDTIPDEADSFYETCASSDADLHSEDRAFLKEQVHAEPGADEQKYEDEVTEQADCGDSFTEMLEKEDFFDAQDQASADQD